MLPGLTERIYEAAFIPEYWESVIADIVGMAAAASGAMLLVDPRLPPLWSATRNIHEQLGAYAQTPGWYNNPRMLRLLHGDHGDAAHHSDRFPEADILRPEDAFIADLAK